MRIDRAGNQHVRFGIIHQGVAGANFGEWRAPDVVHAAGRAADGDALIGLQAQAGDVVGMQQDHVAAGLAAIDSRSPRTRPY